MSVRAFRLENFMGFGSRGHLGSSDPRWIELRDICLVFGLNSSGKSALLRALRLLKQSVREGTEEEALIFQSDRGANLGSFRELVHGRDDSLQMAFHFRLDPTPAVDRWLQYAALRKALGLWKQGFPQEEKNGWLEISLRYGIWEKEQPLGKRTGCVGVKLLFCWENSRKKRCEATLISAERKAVFDTDGDQKQRVYLPWKVQEIAFLPELEALSDLPLQDGTLPVLKANPLDPPADLTELEYLWEFAPNDGRAVYPLFELAADLLSEAYNSLKDFLNKIEFIAPIRPAPEHTYVLKASDLRRFQDQGLGGWVRLLSGLEGREKDEIELWLSKLGLGKRIHVHVFLWDPQVALISRVGVDEWNGRLDDVNISLLGFGISQVLPIIAQCVLAEPGSLLVIEQPELHLHPRAQADLADVFIACTKKHNFRLLVETHSEHLLLRMQRRIAETTARFDILSLYVWKNSNLRMMFVYKREEQSYQAHIVISDEGEIEFECEEEPEEFIEFFADDFEETARLVEARLHISKRRRG